jgi:hypothetical protein
MAHEVVLQAFCLSGVQSVFDVAADACVHAINAIARSQPLVQLATALRDTPPGRFRYLNQGAAACHPFDIFDA